MTGGMLVPVWTTTSWYTFISPRITRPMPRVMISGWTLKMPTPMPFDDARDRGGQQGEDDRGSGTELARSGVAMMNAAIEATVPTDRSMPPVSIASVWRGGEDGERDRRRGSSSRPSRLDQDPGLRDLHHDDEQHEQRRSAG